VPFVSLFHLQFALFQSAPSLNAAKFTLLSAVVVYVKGTPRFVLRRHMLTFYASMNKNTFIDQWPTSELTGDTWPS